MDNSEIYDLLKKNIIEENILINEPMSKHTSFKIGGNADFFVRAKSCEDVKKIIKISKENNIPLTIIGNGSNMLVKDIGVRGIVLKIDINKIEIIELNEKNNDKLNVNSNQANVIVSVGAGVLLGKLAFDLLKKSISGLEFASGIPGTIGGAVRMNAGAYGSEFKDIVVETTCIDRNGNIIILNNEQQKFEYRKSLFKDENYIILEAKLLLNKIDDASLIKEKMDEHKKSRLEKQPIEFPSAGSTFKRGSDFITAKLIDECGLKGYSIGGAQVSEKHAGFIINKGTASFDDVYNLIEYVKKCVKIKFDKDLELEVEIIG